MNSNSDLQATQFVIDLFEKSKAHNEEALENLSGIYAVISEDGKILKGNKNLAQLFNTNHEELLGLNMTQILDSDNQKIFKNGIDSLAQGREKSFALRIDVMAGDKTQLNYLWDLSCFTGVRPELSPLFSIVGRDVTDLTSATQQKTRMQLELNTARLVQERLFQVPAAKFGRAMLAGSYEPASECGGDWWHYSKKGEKIFLWIGDVTGHGVGAALVVSAINSAVSIIESSDITPGQALTQLNKIVHTTGKDQLTMTFFAASIDLNSRECLFSSAAHEPLYRIPGAPREITYRDIQTLPPQVTLPLGAKSNTVYENQNIELKSGERLFLFTDGLKDVKSPEGKKWENLKLQRILAPIVSEFQNPVNVVNGLKKEIKEHRQGTPLIDDVTFVVFAIE